MALRLEKAPWTLNKAARTKSSSAGSMSQYGDCVRDREAHISLNIEPEFADRYRDIGQIGESDFTTVVLPELVLLILN